MQHALACAFGFWKRYLMDESTHYGSRWFSVWVRHLPGEWEGVEEHTSMFEIRDSNLQKDLFQLRASSSNGYGAVPVNRVMNSWLF